MLSTKFREFASSLYETDNVDQAFHLLECYVQRMGFDAALYMYIPGYLVQSGFIANPVHQCSNAFAPEYIAHYIEAGFYGVDPMMKAVIDDVKQPIDWYGAVCNNYKEDDKRSREVTNVSLSYGLKNAVTLPLLTGKQSIAAVSLVNFQSSTFDRLLNDTMPELRMIASMYHNHIVANEGNLGHFIKPVFASLSCLELQFLAGLAGGSSLRELAVKLGRSEKYLEQVFLRIRRKVSGVGTLDKPAINRNQLLYYAGLYNIANFAVLE